MFTCFLILSALLWRDVLRPLGDQRGGERARHFRVPKVSFFCIKTKLLPFSPNVINAEETIQIVKTLLFLRVKALRSPSNMLVVALVN